MPVTFPHRWFQFRLRTLLIAVAMLAVPMAWVGFSLRWIAERRAVVRDQYSPSGPNHFEIAFSLMTPDQLQLRPDAPGLLWVFGEPAVPVVVYEAGSTPTREDLASLFPEAVIVDLPK